MASKVVRNPRARRILRQLPDAMRAELVDALNRGGDALVATVKSRTPRRSGALAAGIRKKVLPQSLRLRVGLVGPVKERRQLFYGRILDLGRKAQTVAVAPRKYANRTFVRQGGRRVALKTFVVRVRAIAPKRFITGQYPQARSIITGQVKFIWERALARIAGGDG
ncbi:MAG: HK97 gp10 family phage protein [Sphingomonas sp.]|nr:HK97 gp10 family phage protein [Sphingomonas sp.]